MFMKKLIVCTIFTPKKSIETQMILDNSGFSTFIIFGRTGLAFVDGFHGNVVGNTAPS